MALGTWRGGLTAGAAGSLTGKREGADGAGEGDQEQQQLDLHGWREVDDVSPSSTAAEVCVAGGVGAKSTTPVASRTRQARTHRRPDRPLRNPEDKQRESNEGSSLQEKFGEIFSSSFFSKKEEVRWGKCLPA